ncbi:MAG: glycosyltransferase family 39 protein [Anaerolineales bacterium]
MPTSTSTVRVPTPEEISSWVSSLKSRLYTYIMEPEHQVMWGILLLAAVLRLAHLDLIELRGEHVGHLQTALALLGREYQWEAQALSAASDTLPMFHNLLGFPLLLGRDPRFVSAFIALLNVAAIGGFYSLVRRYYGLRVSILASTFFATAPWAVVFSRRISCEALIIPLSLLLLQGCATALLDREPLGWSLAAISLGVMLYTTLLALPLTFAFITLIAIYHRRVRWPYLLFGVCLALLIFTPYLYEQNLSRFADLRPHLQRLLMKTNVLPAQRGLDVATWLHSGQQLSTLVVPSEEDFLLTSSLFSYIPQLEGVLFLLTLPGTVILTIHAWGHWKNGQDHARYALPATFLWASLLAIGLQPGPLEPRSLVILYPWGFMAMGLLIDRGISLCARQRRHGFGWTLGLRLGLYLLCLLLILWNAYAVAYLYDFLPRHNTEEAYGIPYRFWKQAANLVCRETTEIGEDRAWVITEDDAKPPAAGPLSYLTAPRLKMVYLPQDDCPNMLLPAGRPGIYLFTHPAPLVEDTVQQLGGETRGAVLFPSGQRLRLEIVEAKEIQDLLEPIQEREVWTFDAGLQLIGYDWNSRNAALITHWTFFTLPPLEQRREHRLCTCLQAEATEGEQTTWVVCCNGLGLNERHWEEGLVLKQWHSLPEDAPSHEYELLMQIQEFHAPPGTEAHDIQPYHAQLGTVSASK